MSLLPYEVEVYSNYTEYRAYKWLLWSVSPAILTMGTVGNVLATWVLWQGSKHSSTFAYLLVLGFADEVALLSGLLRNWITHITGVNISMQSVWLCVSSHFVSTASTYLSVMLIVAVTIERAGMVQQKTVRPASASVRKARIMVALITAACLLVNAHWLFTLDLYNHTWPGTNDTMLICELKSAFSHLRVELAWIDSSLYCFVPFFVILVRNCSKCCLIVNGHVYLEIPSTPSNANKVCNCRIIHVLRTAGRYPDGGGGGSGGGGVAIEMRGLRRDSSHGRLLDSAVMRPPRASVGSFNRNFRQVTVTLLSVSGLFLTTALPITALKVATSLCGFVTVDYTNPLFHSRYLLVQTCTELLMYTNHSSNFFLYCLCGKKFRRELKAKLSRLMALRRRAQSNNTGGTRHVTTHVTDRGLVACE